MFCTTSETKGEVGAVVLLWFSVASFGVRVSMMFYFMCVHIMFSSVSFAEWLPFWK